MTQLTGIERLVAVAQNNLESVIVSVSILEFIPYTLTMIITTAVTQLDDDGQRCRLTSLRIIAAKSTNETSSNDFEVGTQNRI